MSWEIAAEATLKKTLNLTPFNNIYITLDRNAVTSFISLMRYRNDHFNFIDEEPEVRRC